METSSLPCPYCTNQYKNIESLRTHLYRCRKNPKAPNYDHSAPNSARKAHRSCQYPGCDYKYWFKTVLIEHLREVHHVDIQQERNLEFQTWEEFCAWKDDEEEASFSYFSRSSGRQKGTLYYYYCQRDGPDQRHSKLPEEPNDSADGSKSKPRKRGPNAKGRAKTGAVCIAMMKVKRIPEGPVKVTYFPSHSHPVDAQDIKHHPLSRETKALIERQVSVGVSPRRIMNILQGDKFSSVKKPSLTRNDFIQLKSIKEWERSAMKKRPSVMDDDAAVQLLVDDLRREPYYNPILLFKPTGGDMVLGPSSGKLLNHDNFAVGIQTQEQLKFMKECAKSIILLDITRDSDLYGCQLLSVFGVDETNKGYPIGHCISNKIDDATFQCFMSAIEERASRMKVQCVISKEDPLLMNSIQKWDSDVRHLLCVWQLRKNLLSQIQMKLQNKDIGKDMMTNLSAMIDAKTELDFYKFVRAFEEKYRNRPQSAALFSYFEATCLPKKEKWAMCYREFPHQNVDTTIYVESFHNNLKYRYSKQRRTKKVETLINLLLELEKEHYSRRLVNTNATPGGKSTIIDIIGSRHKKSLSLPESKLFEVVKDTQWEVRTSSEKVYDIVKCSSVCPDPGACFYQCGGAECLNLCSHMYVCTCQDEAPLCKHIHKVHSLEFKLIDEEGLRCSSIAPEVYFYELGDVGKVETVETTELIGEEELVEDHDVQEDTEVEDDKQEVRNMALELMNHIEDDEVFELLHTHIRAVLSQLNSDCQSVKLGEFLKIL